MLRKILSYSLVVGIVIITFNLISACSTQPAHKSNYEYTNDMLFGNILLSHNSEIDSQSIPKIIHLSDIHIGSEACKVNYENCEREFENVCDILIKWSRINNGKEYVIMITGDIVDKSLPNDNYNNMRKARLLINELDKHFRKVLIIPGNHDLKTTREENISQVSLNKFKEIFYGADEVSKEYPKLDIIGNVAFIGLNSLEGAIGKTYSDYYGDLNCGSKQLQALEKLIENRSPFNLNEKKIVLYFHHPLECSSDNAPHQQRFVKKIKSYILENKVAAILTGHTHDITDKNIEWDGVLEHNAGTTTGKKRNQRSNIRILDLENKNIKEIEL